MAYIAAGYTTVVLTNHLSAATFHPFYYKGADDWQSKIDHYLSAYRRFCSAAGDRLHVLLGAEICPDRYGATDFLVYGMTEEFLRSHPDLLACNIEELSGWVRTAGMRIYQAHPFRDRMVITSPHHLDGIEVYNAQRRECSRNDMAELWAKRFHLPGIAGSDNHRDAADAVSGIETDEIIKNNDTLLKILASGQYRLIRGGEPMEDET